MARRRYYRRKLKLKLKKQTVYTIVGVSLLAVSLLLILSFFQDGTVLAIFRDEVVTFFGLTTILLPIIFVSFAFLMLGVKSRFAKAHVPIGLTFSFISLLGITQEGRIGLLIWRYLDDLISPLGGLIILVGILIIGVTVLFNTSIDRLLFMVVALFAKTRLLVEKHLLATLFSKREKGVFDKAKIELKVKGSGRQMIIPRPTTAPEVALSTVDEQSKISSIPAPKTVDLGIYEYPPLSLLSHQPGTKADRGDIKKNAAVIESTLKSFGIEAQVVEVNLGPAVTQYALEIALGTKISKITALGRDLALALAAPTGQIRIEAPIPGRRLVGIEVPNRSLEIVTMRQMLESPQMRQAKSKLAVSLGLDVSGTPVVADIARMPHVLIAGTTGSGKSVLMNSIISCLLFRTNPNEVKLLLVDPKRVELTSYNGIPHLLYPVIVDIENTISSLKWALKQMNERYKMFAEVGVRNIDSYHEQAGFQSLPYIVIFIDELADLMAYAPVEVEDTITRIAQMARATGIHLIVSTQRPSVNVITGLIKANIPCRIAFSVSSMVDSRVIIDMPGAENLLGRGDMLYIPPDQAKPTRIQGTFISEQEVFRLVGLLKKKEIKIEYTEEVVSMPVQIKKTGMPPSTGMDGRDELFAEAVRVVCQYDRASASLLQRRLSIGYARAARILDQLEEAGVVSSGEGSKPRDVLVRNPDEYLSQTQV